MLFLLMMVVCLLEMVAHQCITLRIRYIIIDVHSCSENPRIFRVLQATNEGYKIIIITNYIGIKAFCHYINVIQKSQMIINVYYSFLYMHINFSEPHNELICNRTHLQIRQYFIVVNSQRNNIYLTKWQNIPT